MGSVGAQFPDPGTARQIHDYTWFAFTQCKQSIAELFYAFGKQSVDVDLYLTVSFEGFFLNGGPTAINAKGWFESVFI